MSSETEHLAPEGEIQGSESTYSSMATLVLAFAS